MSENKKNGKAADKKPRKATPFLARVNKGLDLLEKKGKALGAALLRAGKTDVSSAIVDAITSARTSIADLPADFKPTKAGRTRAYGVGTHVEIVPTKRGDFAVMGEAIAAGQFEVLSLGEKSIGVKSLVNTAIVSFFKKGDLQIPGTPPRKPRAKNGEGKRAKSAQGARA